MDNDAIIAALATAPTSVVAQHLRLRAKRDERFAAALKSAPGALPPRARRGDAQRRLDAVAALAAFGGTTAEIAEHLKLHPETVRRLLRKVKATT